MSAEIHHLVELVPGWDSTRCECEPLAGGRTNQNFLVRVSGKSYILRIGAPHAGPLGIRRSDEYTILRAAAAAELAPSVFWADENRGLLVSDFIDGRHWSPHEIHDDDNLARLTSALRAVHSLQADVSSFDPIALGLQFAAHCDTAFLSRSLIKRWVTRVRNIASGSEGRSRLCLSHNDACRGNFIDDGTRLWFIDWECAGVNDPFYDLATVSHNNRLSPAQEAELLRLYAGCVSAADVEHLARLKVAHDFYHVLWYAWQLSAEHGADDFQRDCEFHAARLDEELRAFGDNGLYQPLL